MVVDETALANYLKEMVRLGKSNKMLLNYMAKDLGIRMSLATLKRRLKRYEIGRKGQNVAVQLVQEKIATEIQQSGTYLGYRAMATRMRVKYGLQVPVHTVRLTKNGVVPPIEFVVARSARKRMKWCPGPNHRWSADGHDKLQAYGIYIHACIDVFSRKVIWCKAFSTNRHQPTIAAYFLDAVEAHGVSPTSVSADFGAETDQMSRCQVLLWNTTAAQKRMYSTSNNAIERFWGELQRICTKTWADRFEALEKANLYSENSQIDRWAVHAVLLPLIQHDIDEAINEYHQHKVRYQRDNCRPCGIPEDLYNFPEAFGKRQCGLLVTKQQVDRVRRLENVENGGGHALLPFEVREIVDDWMWSSGIRVDQQNAIVMYLKVRRLLLATFGPRLRHPPMIRVPFYVVR